MTKRRGSRKRMTKWSSHSWKDNSWLSWKLEERLRNQTSWLWIHIGTLRYMNQQNDKIRCKRWRKQMDWMPLIETKDRDMNEWDWLDSKIETQEWEWSYEGMRCSGIEQNGRTNSANKQCTKHKLWRLERIYSNSWVETTTLNTAEHLPSPRCWLELHDGTWSNDIFLGRRLSRMSWCRARYLLNWGGRAGKEPTTRLPHKVWESRKLNFHQGWSRKPRKLGSTRIPKSEIIWIQDNNLLASTQTIIYEWLET